MINLIATATILSCGEGMNIIDHIRKVDSYSNPIQVELIEVVKTNMPPHCRGNVQ